MRMQQDWMRMPAVGRCIECSCRKTTQCLWITHGAGCSTVRPGSSASAAGATAPTFGFSAAPAQAKTHSTGGTGPGIERCCKPTASDGTIIVTAYVSESSAVEQLGEPRLVGLGGTRMACKSCDNRQGAVLMRRASGLVPPLGATEFRSMERQWSGGQGGRLVPRILTPRPAILAGVGNSGSRGRVSTGGLSGLGLVPPLGTALSVDDAGNGNVSGSILSATLGPATCPSEEVIKEEEFTGGGWGWGITASIAQSVAEGWAQGEIDKQVNAMYDALEASAKCNPSLQCPQGCKRPRLSTQSDATVCTNVPPPREPRPHPPFTVAVDVSCKQKVRFILKCECKPAPALPPTPMHHSPDWLYWLQHVLASGNGQNQPVGST